MMIMVTGEFSKLQLTEIRDHHKFNQSTLLEMIREAHENVSKLNELINHLEEDNKRLHDEIDETLLPKIDSLKIEIDSLNNENQRLDMMNN